MATFTLSDLLAMPNSDLRCEITEVAGDTEEKKDFWQTAVRGSGSSDAGQKKEADEKPEDDEDDDDDENDNEDDDEDEDSDPNLERLAAMLSAFLQDDKGRNIVDALVYHNKVQTRICKALERIADTLQNAKASE